MAMGRTLTGDGRTGENVSSAGESATWQAVRGILSAFASLKLTVVLFALAMIIVFAGTLAQTKKDVWVVVREYFRTPIAWIDFQVFFPKAFFQDMDPVSGGFYFPGGWLIGFLMAVNLLAAHSLRFTIQTSGARLKAGLGVIGLGSLMTWLVVASGSSDALHGESMFEWSTLWVIVKFALAALALGGVCLVTSLSAERRLERRLTGILTAVLGALAVWLFWKGDEVSLGASSMRILWQLLQGGLAGLVLLAGCWLVFQKRAGIVLLHAGIGLMMFSELLVGTLAIETRMTMAEGETAIFVQDLHTSELVVVAPLTGDDEQVTAVRQSMLLRGLKREHAFLPAWCFESLPDGLQRLIGCRYGERIVRHEYLPFDVEVVRYLQNTAPPRRIRSGDDNPATAGIGTEFIMDERPTGKGTDAEAKFDIPAAYVKLLKKGTDESLGTYLVGTYVSRPERVTVDGTTYDVALRFKRIYKPYSMRLIDVRADNYLGTEMTRNYSSDIRLVDPTRDADREVHIWMNNPLRFAGETFYQSGYDKDPRTGVETTTLQVVSNTGWMIPYVSCMIVGVGMLFQFSVTLLRFLKRRDAGEGTVGREDAVSSLPAAVAARSGRDARSGPRAKPGPRPNARDESPPTLAADQPGLRTAGWVTHLFAWGVALLAGAYVAGKAQPPRHHEDVFDFYQAGKIPVVYQGRVKPFDTLARNSLKIVSWKETFVDGKEQTQPAVRWLLDLAMKPEEAEKYEVFWIDNPDVIKFFKLTPRQSHLYSGAELKPRFKEFRKEVREAHDTPPEKLTVFQRRMAELDRQLREVQLLQGAFIPMEIGELPSAEDLRSNDPEARQRVADFRELFVDGPRRLAEVHPPRVVPVKVDPADPFSQMSETKEKFDWQPFSTAWMRSRVKMRLGGGDPDPAATAWSQIYVAYAKDDPQTFNQAVRDYRALLAKDPPAQLQAADLDFETFFNHFAPFYYSAVLYLGVFLLAALSWLVWTVPLNRAAFALTLVALAVHSFALVSRMYISGRPPVTNLYATAVFIGWGCVVLCLIFELFYRSGIGTVIAGVTGFATLLVSHFLSGDGDTFTVLQAVLDTQFWLATHVVIINLGYAATLLSGMFGMLYILRGILTPSLTPAVERDLTRMIYGTLCFAIFFSFVGTVLGGLWADDSWGRFWGWDPKENGALLIVLWNALVLHARWGGMVKSRGLAVLAVFGCIVTTWSWFGVNGLGVGLHAYGFKAGVLQTMARFDASQVFIIALGCLPKEAWWSFRARRPSA